MFNIDFTFLFTAINLLILYLVVRKLLFKKLGAFMSERSGAIADDIEKAAALKTEGENFQIEQQELLAASYDERKKILEEARQQAAKEYEAVVKKAKADAERIVAEAREETERERDRLKKDLKREIAALVIAASSKVIKANMDNDKNRALVDQFLMDEGAA